MQCETGSLPDLAAFAVANDLTDASVWDRIARIRNVSGAKAIAVGVVMVTGAVAFFVLDAVFGTS